MKWRRVSARALCASLSLLVLVPTLASCRCEQDRARPSNRDDLRPLVAARQVVSLSPNMTELLFGVGAGDRVVGVTRFCTRPPEAASREIVGGFTDISLEKVLSLKPDLVVVARGPGAAATADAIARRGIPLYWSRVLHVHDIRRTTRELGELLGHEQEAAALVARIDEGVRAAAEVRPEAGLRVLLLVGLHPLTAAGPDTYLDELLELAGGANVLAASRADYPVLSEEALRGLKPDRILDFAMGADTVSEEQIKRWRQRGITYRKLHGDVYLRPSQAIIPALDGIRRALSK
jgi:iron complex transport system substrate-binding protein